MKKKIGINFLHEHPSLQQKLGVPTDHVIVDREDWGEIVSKIRSEEKFEDRIAEMRDLLESDEFKKEYSKEPVAKGRIFSDQDIDEAIRKSIPPNPDKNKPCGVLKLKGGISPEKIEEFRKAWKEHMNRGETPTILEDSEVEIITPSKDKEID